MCILDVDREEGTISDEEFDRIDGDYGLYLDRFEDSFNRPIVPMELNF